MKRRTLAALFLGTLLSTPAQAQTDSAAFVIRLGTDTVAVERYVRTADRIVVEAVQRSPSTTLHRFEYALTPQGAISAGEWSMRRPGMSEPAARRTFRFTGESAVVTSFEGTNRREQPVAVSNAIPMAGPFYTPYELAMMRAVRGEAEVPLLAGANVVRIPLTRVGSDSVTLENQFGEPMRAHVDAQGRLLHLHTPAFTTVERVAWVDLDALARDFAERDRSGRGLGMLSPRQTTRTTVAGANLWLDYSRPAMRGRPIWGRLVPWNAVWRTGANDAVHFSTDRAVQLGELSLEPGTYTLFVQPSPERWQLFVNRGTGISGLERDPAKDVGSTVMTTETLADPVELFTMDIAGGDDDARLTIAWDRTAASVPLRVR